MFCFSDWLNQFGFAEHGSHSQTFCLVDRENLPRTKKKILMIHKGTNPLQQLGINGELTGTILNQVTSWRYLSTGKISSRVQNCANNKAKPSLVLWPLHVIMSYGLNTVYAECIDFTYSLGWVICNLFSETGKAGGEINESGSYAPGVVFQLGTYCRCSNCPGNWWVLYANQLNHCTHIHAL